MYHLFQYAKKVGLHLTTRLYRVPVFCSQEDDDGDFGGGFMDWSPPHSPVSTLTHPLHTQ